MTRIVFVMLVFGSASGVFAAAEKQFKPGEYEVYNQVLQDLRGTDGAKALTDLDVWRQKFPESDYKDDRVAFYVQSYLAANQQAKALDAAGELMAKDLPAVFSGPDGSGIIVRLLYNAVWAASQAVELTDGELQTGAKAAQQLLQYDTAPAGVPADKWAEARTEMRAKASAALLYIAMRPGIQAMAKQPPDCAGAVESYSKAVSEYPDKAALAWELGRALTCEAKTAPEKQSAAIYQYVRAAALDPTLGDSRNDPKKIQTFATNTYVRLHGSEEGLNELRERVKGSPLPGADFRIRSAAEIQEEEQQAFEREHPQIALWMRIKAALTAVDGVQFFESQMKDRAVPQLTGTLVDAKPACRSKELLIAMPVRGGEHSQVAEIRLVLDKALTGKPEIGAELQWEGVPSAFTPKPFLLTMDTEADKLTGVRVTSCAVAPPRKPLVRKTPARR